MLKFLDKANNIPLFKIKSRITVKANSKIPCIKSRKKVGNIMQQLLKLCAHLTF